MNIYEQKKTHSQTLFHDRTFNTNGIEASKKKRGQMGAIGGINISRSSSWDVGEGAQY